MRVSRATGAALLAATANSGRTSLIRSTSIAPAAVDSTDSGSSTSPVGTASGSRCRRRSDVMRSGARLVAKTCSEGTAARRSATKGTAAATCSTLSSTKSVRVRLRTAAMLSSVDLPATVRASTAAAILVGTSSGSAIVASRMTTTRVASATDRARCKARAVLPTPTPPTIVTSRSASSDRSASAAAISEARPINVCGGIAAPPSPARGDAAALSAATAARSSPASAGVTPNACSSSDRVIARGARATPRSMSLMVRALTPDRSASVSCESPARERKVSNSSSSAPISLSRGALSASRGGLRLSCEFLHGLARGRVLRSDGKAPRSRDLPAPPE